ncbi:MAG: histidine phosphatase family protein [Defluviitaleaceae bacterium]|nr:histidine phosphatase family protein [Defluviitaleaceae bacterium]
MRITTIRHGETDWNRERKPQGSCDIELNAAGIKQAEKLAARLADEACEIIYTSDLSRAKKTAEIINTHHGVELVASSQLRETSFGEFEGKSINDPQTAAAFSKFLDERAPAYFAQIQGYLKEIISCGKENIFIVGHHGTIRAIICGLLERPIADRVLFDIGNTAIHMFEKCDDGSFQMILENDTMHL